ncbi:MAG TPA: hypothetical protein VN368_03390 [Candidatus Methylomirabilis sp.]|nr:hypothetical protein [Candidatus Methylomirabilis sp.]
MPKSKIATMATIAISIPMFLFIFIYAITDYFGGSYQIQATDKTTILELKNETVQTKSDFIRVPSLSLLREDSVIPESDLKATPEGWQIVTKKEKAARLEKSIEKKQDQFMINHGFRLKDRLDYLLFRNPEKARAFAARLSFYDWQALSYIGGLNITALVAEAVNIEAIHTDPEQSHLRYIKTVGDWNKTFRNWGPGTFQVKITLGDYLCSEMARRYTRFVEAHEELFVNLPDENVWFILQEKAETNEKAEECLAECPFCKGTRL